METADVAVIGAGIAGLSAAAELARSVSVIVVETEATPAHHATGRSAALYIPTYGPPTVRRLTAASAPFFRSANDGRSPTPLVSPRTVMYVADEAHHDHLLAFAAGHGEAGGSLELIDGPASRARCPALRADWVAAAGVDHDALDIDVAATVATFRAGLVERGGLLRTNHRVTALDRGRNGWTLATTGGPISAGTIVNASGAWVDVVAAMAGLAPLGFEPKRRTLAVGPIAAGADPGDHFVAHAAMRFYFGAEHGDLLFSPADETLSEPTDARPEEIDVAIAIDRINEATTLGLRSVRQAWAGLRTFSADGDLVLGPDPADPAFVWCGGQGGYGIHTSAAAAMATASLALGEALPAALVDVGLRASDLVPDRLLAGHDDSTG
ncbi:MAG: FAD-binding oxidoreductase [Ilumatobacter sp.]|nr:FAD-binding oxidoreductase [Ilumatobacter sp.]